MFAELLDSFPLNNIRFDLQRIPLFFPKSLLTMRKKLVENFNYLKNYEFGIKIVEKITLQVIL